MKPHGRSLTDFNQLTPAERTLLDCCLTGKIALIAKSRPEKPTTENTVRAGFLRFLMLGGDPNAPVHEHGVQLCGAYIVDSLDLKCLKIRHAIRIKSCSFSKAPEFTEARIEHSVVLDGCRMPGLEGDRLVTTGVLSMSKVISKGTVHLHGAQIGGGLNCQGASLYGLDSSALVADGAVVRGSINLCHDFKAVGEVRLLGTQINGQLNCNGGNFDGKGGDAISADGALIKIDVSMQMGFNAQGTVRLIGVQINGELNCSGSSFDGKGSPALIADGVAVKGNVFLCDGFKAIGEVRLPGAQINSQLACDGATFDGKDNNALLLDSAMINGDIFLRAGFKAIGKVSLIDTKVNGQIACNNASFDGKDGDALSLNGVMVRGKIFLSRGFQAEGPVRFKGAQLLSQLDCRGANFNGKHGDALSLNGAMVNGDVFLSDGFKAIGAVSFVDAQITGQLDCRGARLGSNGGDALTLNGATLRGNVFLGKGFRAVGAVCLNGAQFLSQLNCDGASFDGKGGKMLSAENMRINGALILCNLKSPLSNASFSGAKVGVLNDEEQAWGENLVLNGFVYDFIDGAAPVRAASRLEWLDKQHPAMAGTDGRRGAESGFRPQPWRQLQHVFNEMGHAEEAREIGIAFESRLRKVGWIGQTPEDWPKSARWTYSKLAILLHISYGRLTGFGYRPMHLLTWFLSIWLFCSGVYWFAAAQKGVFGPSNPIVFQHEDYLNCRPDREGVWRERNKTPTGNLPGVVPKEFTGPGNWYLCENLREEYTGLSPLAFSLDVILPLVDLQQERDWAPMIPTPKADYLEEFTSVGWKYFTRWLIWFETLFGWGVSLLLVAIVSGLARRKE